jgi:RimJ/RimL family protein N-acetyltransferase
MTRRIPELQTERLIIRELIMDDLEPIHRLLNEAFGSDESLEWRQRWLQWTVLGYEMFETLEQPHYGERGIVLKETGELIGAVGIVPYLDTFNRVAAFNRAPDAPATAEVGLYWAVAPAHQRHGYASEAARAVVDYLFTHERLGRIIATTGTGNRASQSVMRKLGMTIEHIKPPQPSDAPAVGVVGVLENSRAAGR